MQALVTMPEADFIRRFGSRTAIALPAMTSWHTDGTYAIVADGAVSPPSIYAGETVYRAAFRTTKGKLHEDFMDVPSNGLWMRFSICVKDHASGVADFKVGAGRSQPLGTYAGNGSATLDWTSGVPVLSATAGGGNIQDGIGIRDLGDGWYQLSVLIRSPSSTSGQRAAVGFICPSGAIPSGTDQMYFCAPRLQVFEPAA